MTFRYEWISTLALAALLVACGGRGGNLPEIGSAQPQAFPHHKTFAFTGGPQSFNVPRVQWLLVDVRGAAGSAEFKSSPGGRGARVSALIPASLDKELIIYVGGAGNDTSYTDNGGFNGGGNGGHCGTCTFGDSGAGGGGASDIRLSGGTISERVIVAAGGGGYGGYGLTGNGGAGGGGGGSVGQAGENGSHKKSYDYCFGYGGKGGTQTAGGAGGKRPHCLGDGLAGDNGGAGAGGAGGNYYNAGGGGGGGGGFFGGGGGGAGAEGYCTGVYCNAGGGGGGGGGSSFTDKRAKNPHVWKAWKTATGNGTVVISW